MRGSGQSPASSARAGDDEFPETLLSRASIEIHSETASINGSHSLDRPISLVGRHPSCELRVLDKELAYFQCALVNTSDGVWFVDTMSRHGAVLNGRNSRFARLREGDLLEFGKVSIVFRSGVHPRDARVAVREVRDVPTPNDLVAAISGKVAEAVEGALIPVGEMLNQFQQCFATMTQMFATMQQQNAMVMSEQIRQIQELAVELRDIRASAQKEKSAQVASAPIPSAPAPEAVPASTPPNVGSPAATPSRTPVPSFNRDIGDAQTLSEAHSWFLSRLQKQSEPPASGS